MENENYRLNPYTLEQMKSSESLPEKISSIAHDIEIAEESRVEHLLYEINKTNKEIQQNTNQNFCFLGSMAMYSYFNDLPGGATELEILESRIAGGKNDFDIAVHNGEINNLMNDFGWSDTDKSIKRGYVGGNHQMIDVMERRELENFQWKTVQINGEDITLQNPVEMIFEKMTALSSSDLGEVKWGVDIKLLKTYLMIKNNFNDSDVENYLNDQFELYKLDINKISDESNNNLLKNIQCELETGKSKQDVMIELIKTKSGNEVIDLEESLHEIFGNNINYNELMNESNEQFLEKLSQLAKIKSNIRYSYGELSDLSQIKYSNMINL